MMNRFLLIYSILLCSIYSYATESFDSSNILDTIARDYRNFYSSPVCWQFGAGMGIAGIFANTTGDGKIQDWYQSDLRNSRTDNFAKYVKPFGNGRWTLPIYVGAALLDLFSLENEPLYLLSNWGKMSLRAILVGAPPMLVLQKALGASRPYEATSKWRPFADNNAVSGHAFMGAIPFMTAAKLSDNNALKSFFYICSSLTAISRINDHKHYFSQSLLGWWIAFLSVRSLNSKENRNNFALSPAADGFIIHFSMTF
ncbi:phosphatase PAP2 family protein [candidate division KSB1 bacterium]|nr:phosphatase PAP2 family protein [candidate division KSB1 bacterium]